MHIWFDLCIKLGVLIDAGVAIDMATPGWEAMDNRWNEDQGALEVLSQICNLAGKMGARRH